MDRSRFLQSFHLKISFLLSLTVILFLLISFVFLSPNNLALANLVQKINSFLSWPDIMLENVSHVSLHWVLTALCIQMFWFVVFFLVIGLFTFIKSKK